MEEHDGNVRISSRNITNLQFPEDINAVAEEEQEQETLVESLNKTCIRYKMEISAEENDKQLLCNLEGDQNKSAEAGFHNKLY